MPTLSGSDKSHVYLPWSHIKIAALSRGCFILQMEEANTTIKPTFSYQIMNEIKDNDANKLLEISASNIESNSNFTKCFHQLDNCLK